MIVKAAGRGERVDGKRDSEFYVNPNDTCLDILMATGACAVSQDRVGVTRLRKVEI
jgi:hypothetical protein